jgi:hypothetical protein
MAMREPAQLLVGVIEGFYGQHWSLAERFELFDWMAVQQPDGAIAKPPTPSEP